MSTRTATQTWQCPQCGQKYLSPVRILSYTHRCPRLMGVAVGFKESRT